MQEPPKESGPEETPAAYVIEGARSSRSRCKTCRRAIDKGTLRIGMLIEGPYGVGYLWHHLRCAARRSFDRVAEAYELEAWNAAKQPPSKVPPLDELEKHLEEAEKRQKERKTIPYAELAPSGRSRCKQCSELIEKDTLRIVLGKLVEFGNQTRTAPMHVHAKCVAGALAEEDSAVETPGFEAALRANTTDVEPDQLDDAINQIGDVT